MQPELIPGQNSWGTQAGSEQRVAQQQKVLRNTYLLLALSLIPTGIGALIGVNLNFGFMRASPMISSLVLLAAIYGMFFAIEKNRDNGLGVALLLALTFFLGILLGPILQYAGGFRNGGQLVALATGGTAAVFFAMAGIASVTKRDLGFLTNFLAVGGIVIMLAVVANIFFASPVMSLAICGAFVLFSSLMILWQVHNLVNGGETNYISATLTLYMSIYNLFTSLLQLLLAFSGNRD